MNLEWGLRQRLATCLSAFPAAKGSILMSNSFLVFESMVSVSRSPLECVLRWVTHAIVRMAILLSTSIHKAMAKGVAHTRPLPDRHKHLCQSA